MRASNAGRGGRGRRKAKRRQDQREENTEKKKKKAESKNFPSPKNHTQGNKPEAGKGGGCSPRPVLAAPGGGGGRGKAKDGRTAGQTDAGLLPAGGRQPLAPAGWSSTCRGPRRGGRGGVGAVRPQPTAGPPSPLPAGGQPPFPARPGARTSPGDRQLPRPGAGLSAPLPLFLPFRGVFLALPACGRRRLHFGAERGATGGGRGEGCCTAAPGGLDPRVSVHREGAWALDGAGGGGGAGGTPGREESAPGAAGPTQPGPVCSGPLFLRSKHPGSGWGGGEEEEEKPVRACK